MVTIIMMSLSILVFPTKSHKPYFEKGGIAAWNGSLVHQLSYRWNVKDQTKMSAQYFGTSDYIDGGTYKCSKENTATDITNCHYFEPNLG